ncbi:MAG: prephenate dehydratase [Patescibacteria group bacterium]
MDKTTKKVVFKGESGSYGEEAAYQFFGEDSVKAIPVDFYQDIFEMVKNGGVDYGVVPIENTLRGSEGEIFNLLTKSPLFIYGETEIRVDYCLIGPEGSRMKDIKRVFANPEALRQVRSFIKDKDLVVIPSYRPMERLKVVADNGEKKTGAIFNERAAENFDMELLEREVEVEQEDFTRYFLISKRENKEEGNFMKKTSIIFQTGHKPGVLLDILEEFSKRDINLTRLESQPIAGHPWVYRFFLDFEGDKRNPTVKKAFKKVKDKALFFKFLGTYPVKK